MKNCFALTVFFTLFLPLSFLQAATEHKEATLFTKQANDAVLQTAPFADTQDFADASRGFVATLANPVIKDASGNIVWDLGAFTFLEKEVAPSSVNPSLWRQARLNMKHGLFKVAEGLYQIRGFDISNMTIIEGNTGLIIIDPLVSTETATAGLNLYYSHVPQPGNQKRPVKAVLYTHSHIDHFGGVKGVTSEEDAKAGKVAIIAPAGFMDEAVSENVFAGTAMSRRATYMYGTLLPVTEKGRVDAGLGKAVSSGQVTLIPPTDIIENTGDKRTVDGVVMEFLMAPHTEAPSEMLIFLPDFKALCAAEDATHTLHNLYTLRGAKVRDANLWWQALDEALALFGDRTEIVFAQHHWPMWGKESVGEYLKAQRDGYKYIHDQTLRLANLGYTPLEISEKLELPASLAGQWHLRDYYGTISHNVKAVYQFYLGWFDGNPANLHPLPPTEAAKRYVVFMGGAEVLLQKAKASYELGEYRWVAEVLRHLVFAEPENMAARTLQADALEQLGYQAESGPWRGFYLTGAQELRDGILENDGTGTVSPDMLRAIKPEMVLDFMAVHVNGPRAEGKKCVVNWVRPEDGEIWAMSLENSVLHYIKGGNDAAEATITMPTEVLTAVIAGGTTLDKSVAGGLADIKGNRDAVFALFGLLDVFPPQFPIMTP